MVHARAISITINYIGLKTPQKKNIFQSSCYHVKILVCNAFAYPQKVFRSEIGKVSKCYVTCFGMEFLGDSYLFLASLYSRDWFFECTYHFL